MTHSISPIKTLLIEETMQAVHEMRALLSKASESFKCELLHANRLELGLAYLEEMRFDAVLLSVALCGANNGQALTKIRTAAPAVPILILSGPDDEETAVQLTRQGAQGYLRYDQLSANTLYTLLTLAGKQSQLHAKLEKAINTAKAHQTSCRHILERNVDGLVIVDNDGVILMANALAERLLARTQLDLIGGSFDFSPIKSDTAELDVKRANGETAVIEMRQTKIRWEGQNAHMVSLRDVTAHYRAKNDLAQKAAQLETRNAELDTFAQTTAHQIQGLLSQMIGYTSYLDMHYRPNLDDTGQGVVRHVLRSGHKMSNVLSELFLLATVDKNDIPLVALDMERIVAEAQKRIAFETEERDGTIIKPGVWPVVTGYGSWIEEAWVNYISNALKYGGEPPQITLGWEAVADKYIRFWVKDNGPGIAPEDQKRLFKAHTRLRQIRATGEGLGLSIVHRIIKKCGGEVGVDSAPGAGSVFWFTLPRAENSPT